MPGDYFDPVAQLLSYGACSPKRRHEKWPDYLKLGLTEDDVPDLIRMVSDSDLNRADSSSLDVWAPVHAWRALGQLRAEKAARPLVTLFQEYEDDDWLRSELPKVFSLIGPGAIATLEAFLENESVKPLNRITIPACLERIAEAHADHRDACIGVLVRQLRKYVANDETLNAFIVLSLAELQAIEAIDVIRKAFSRECVDLVVQGDLEDVEIMMGLRLRRSTPRPRLHQLLGPAGQNLIAGLGIDDGHAEQFSERHHRKVGRNAPCPCGSGKKFKKCCLH